MAGVVARVSAEERATSLMETAHAKVATFERMEVLEQPGRLWFHLPRLELEELDAELGGFVEILAVVAGSVLFQGPRERYE